MKDAFLGIDFSTQSVSAAIIEPESANAHCASVNFERDLPQYGTAAGAVTSAANKLEVWSYPAMWLEALDMLIARLGSDFDLSKVRAVSGAGQQHASVWLNSVNAFKEISAAPRGALAQASLSFLSRERAPIWMDASTAAECAQITAAAGGEAYVLDTTGSIAAERFTAAQIRKIFMREPHVYENTRRIHLNSSFMCSVFCGEDAPVDLGDGAGMNLLDLRSKIWDARMLEATAPNLAYKLPRIAASSAAVGEISNYFQTHCGFARGTKVCAFTGDNPSSLVGLGASRAGCAAISLGTSDTFFCANDNFAPAAGAHVFGNPTGGFMNLICFRNGSLAREAFKNSIGLDWAAFDGCFANYTPLCDDKYILPFCFDEISPKLSSCAPVFAGLTRTQTQPIEAARLFIEGQMLNMRLCAAGMGAHPLKIILTGGASKSEALAQCAADVFNAPVYTIGLTHNSAALGAAMRAAASQGADLKALEETFCAHKHFKSPRQNCAEIYAHKLCGFKAALKSAFRTGA